VRTQDLARLTALAAMWGASFLFLRYAVPSMGAVLLVELRVAIAGLALLAFVLATGGSVGWKRHWRAYLFVGTVGLAAPFTLIAQAVSVIDASTAAILNALSPLFASIVAAIWIRDPLTPAKLAGIALCLVGTAVLVGWTPVPMSARELLAASLSVAATALYGYTIVFTKVHLRDANPMATSAGRLAGCAIILAGCSLILGLVRVPVRAAT
jgi:drug/metabolite transporter (DMT)-like permease